MQKTRLAVTKPVMKRERPSPSCGRSCLAGSEAGLDASAEGGQLAIQVEQFPTITPMPR
jgi:hypothetical protein